MFNTINEAIANANDGSTITVLDGIYNEVLTIDKEVMIVAKKCDIIESSNY